MDAGIHTWNLGQVRTGLGVSSDFALFSLGRGATTVPGSLNPRETVHCSRPLCLKRGESRDSLHRTGGFGAQMTLSHQAARGSKLASGGSVTQGWWTRPHSERRFYLPPRQLFRQRPGKPGRWEEKQKAALFPPGIFREAPPCRRSPAAQLSLKGCRVLACLLARGWTNMQIRTTLANSSTHTQDHIPS